MTCRIAALLLAVVLVASGAVSSDQAAAIRTLFDAAEFVEDNWHHVRFVNETRYARNHFAGEAVIQATPGQSSSMLLRSLRLDVSVCPRLEWRWLVTRVQRDADIRERDKEDVGAAVLLLFGEPASLFGPRAVPVLRYVWTNDRIRSGTVVDSPFMPGVIRSIVVRSGAAADDSLVTETRDVAADFRAAFGRDPPNVVHAVGILAENDQTGQTTSSYFAWARALCIH